MRSHVEVRVTGPDAAAREVLALLSGAADGRRITAGRAGRGPYDRSDGRVGYYTHLQVEVTCPPGPPSPVEDVPAAGPVVCRVLCALAMTRGCLTPAIVWPLPDGTVLRRGHTPAGLAAVLTASLWLPVPEYAPGAWLCPHHRTTTITPTRKDDQTS